MQWRIDPVNPAEVLACAGLAHLAWRWDRAARTGFDAGDGRRVRFTADLAELPATLGLETRGPDAVRLGGVELDWWRPWGANPPLKNWAGRQSASTVHRSLREAAGDSPLAEWLTFSAPSGKRLRGRLYLDPAGTWTTLRLGWSINEHDDYLMCCRPWVELLASLGLQAFPVPGHRLGGGFRYHLWRRAALPVAVAAFAGRGRDVHALQGYHVGTEKSGSNTLLGRATPLSAGPAGP